MLTPLPHCPNAVVVSHREPGRCSFVPDWDTHIGSLLSHADQLGGLCGAEAAYTVADDGGNEAEVCVPHAAHVRACPVCSGWLVSIRTVGTPC